MDERVKDQDVYIKLNLDNGFYVHPNDVACITYSIYLGKDDILRRLTVINTSSLMGCGVRWI